jgi:hypothetical protein
LTLYSEFSGVMQKLLCNRLQAIAVNFPQITESAQVIPERNPMAEHLHLSHVVGHLLTTGGFCGSGNQTEMLALH